MKKLNPAQNFWRVFAIAIFAATIATIYMGWPARDSAVVTDLLAPECEIWRTDPMGAQEKRYHPENENECRALRAFIEHEGVTLRSEADYDSYRLRVGSLMALKFMAGWVIAMAALYAFGWSSGRLVRLLPNWKRSKNR